MSSYWFSKTSSGIMLLSFLFFMKNLNISFLFLDEIYISAVNNIKLTSFLFLFSVSFISSVVFLYSVFYMLEERIQSFYSLVFLFMASMLILIMSESMFMIFLGWEGLGLSSFLLILFYQNWQSLSGASFTILTNRVGDVVLVILFSYILSTTSLKFSLSVFSLVVLLSFTKSAQWPFSSWLPAAMAAPTPVSALVHSSTLVTAGIWLLIRFSQSMHYSFFFLFFIGFFTSFMASLGALMETDLKKLVALSTLSQLGVMVLALVFGGSMICTFHLLAHAFVKAGLFLVVGSILNASFSSQDWREKGNMKPYIFYLFLSFFVISLSGLLFSSGFFSKEMILFFLNKKMGSFLSKVVMIMLAAPTLTYCVKMSKSVSKILNFKILVISDSFSYFQPVFMLFFLGVFMSFFMVSNIFFFVTQSLSMVSFISSVVFGFFMVFYGFLWFFMVSKLTTLSTYIFLKEHFIILINLNLEKLELTHMFKLLQNSYSSWVIVLSIFPLMWLLTYT